MRAVLLGLVGCVVLAGCVAPPGPGETTAEPDGTATAGGSVSVAYEVRPGPIDDGIAHVYLEFGVYLAEHPDDVVPCTPGAPLFDNRFDPTATPVRTPAGACRGFDAGRVELTGRDGPVTLGPFEAEATVAGGHTLVVHDVTVVLDDGTTATGVYDTDFRAVTEASRPAGTYGVEIAVVSAGSSAPPAVRYLVEVERYDP